MADTPSESVTPYAYAPANALRPLKSTGKGSLMRSMAQHKKGAESRILFPASTTMKPTSTLASSLPQPHIHHASSICTDPALERTIRDFVNEGYRYIAPKDASRWDPDPEDRLANAESLNEELGEHGFFAVLYDPNDSSIPIACAATTPWKGDMEGRGKGEEGWEIKTVTSGAQWMGAGCAGRCIDAVVCEIRRQERKKRQNEGCREKEESTFNVWIQTAECVNGAYWNKKGWREVRGYEKPVGHWGSREGYRLAILLQQFDV